MDLDLAHLREGVGHHQVLAVLCMAEGDPPFLVLAVLVIKYRARQRIAKYRVAARNDTPCLRRLVRALAASHSKS